MEQAVLSLEKAAWSIRVLPNDVVVSRSTSVDQYPDPPACGTGTATSSVIFHLPFSHLPHCLEMIGRHEGLSQACTVEFLGEVK